MQKNKSGKSEPNRGQQEKHQARENELAHKSDLNVKRRRPEKVSPIPRKASAPSRIRNADLNGN
jgi:hypothetical protein